MRGRRQRRTLLRRAFFGAVLGTWCGALWVMVLEGPGRAQPQPGIPTPAMLVEVGSAEEREGWSPRDLQPLEDAIAQAFDGLSMRVETRRSRLSRTPPAIYAHAQALQGCANPRWTRARVTQCIQSLQWPNPMPRRPTPQRATHLLRISRGHSTEGLILALTLTRLGKDPSESVARRQLGTDASPGEQRTAVLDMASELLAPLLPPR